MTGKRFAQSYAVTAKVLESLPHEVTEGVITVQPSADVTSPAYELAQEAPRHRRARFLRDAGDRLGQPRRARDRQGEGARPAPRIRDNVRKICQGSGTKVYSAVEGLKLLAQGKDINYEGASGPCDFTEIGDIVDCKFRYNKVAAGQVQVPEGRVTPIAVARPRVAQLRRQRRDGRHDPGGAGHRPHRDLRGAALPELRARLARDDRRVRRLSSPMRGSACRSLPSVASRSSSPGVVGVASDEMVLKPFRARGLHHHGDRLDRADHRARERRALRLRQRAARLRPADPARLALRRHPRRAAAGREPRDRRASRWRRCSSSSRFTRTGKAMRAVADNPMLAEHQGHRRRRGRRASSISSPWASPGSAAC